MRLNRKCLECEHPISAVSEEALNSAAQEHIDYVEQTADRAKDIHFAIGRLDRLITT